MRKTDLIGGHIIAIVGPMFSGKSTGLLSQLKRATIAKRSVVLFKPAIDNRYSGTEVVSHDGDSMPAVVISSPLEAIEYIKDLSVDVVGFDEVQFFDNSIVKVVDDLANMGINVVVAGLSTDFMGAAFDTSASIAMLSDELHKLSAVCMACGADAHWNQRIVDGTEITHGDRVQVGGLETYEPRCRGCFVRQ